MKTADIVSKVRNIINEMATEGDSFSQETDTSILKFIETAAKQVALLPGYKGDPTALNGNSDTGFHERPDGKFYLRLPMPADCLRVVSLSVTGWVTPVYTFHPVTDPRFLAQYSSAPGIGNGPYAPIAFITSDGGEQIIAHAVDQKSEYELRYIAAPAVNTDGTMDMPDKYMDVLAYTTAGLYLQSTDDYSKAKAAFDTAGALLQNMGDVPSQQ